MDFTKLTDFLNSIEKAYGVKSTDCIVTKNHEIVYRHMTGHKDYEGKIAVSENDMYYLYSCTKIITCTAVMQLIERGMIHLYDPVCNYLPEYEVMRIVNDFDDSLPPHFLKYPKQSDACHFSNRQIRIIDLMAMMGGMTYDVASDAIKEAQLKTTGKGSSRELIAAIAAMPLIYEPASRWYYSLAHDVLAAVIEVVSKESFGNYLHEHIFGPLGVTDDMVFSMNDSQESRLSAIYEYDVKTNCIVPCKRDESYKFTENYESGGAGLIGTVSGYSKVIDALSCGGLGANGKRILKENSVRMFSTSVTTGQALRDVQIQEGVEYGYGLGVRVKINAKNGRGPIGEFGWGGAAGAYVCIDPIDHVSIFYVQHVMNFPTGGKLFHPLIRDLAYEGVGI